MQNKPLRSESLKQAGVGTAEQLCQALSLNSPAELGQKALNKLIDHTLLKAEASRKDYETLIREALDCEVFSVCVAPYWVRFAANHLKGSPVKCCTVAGFPLGNHHPLQKLHEAEQALKDGADEVDMVINLGALKSQDYQAVEADIAGLAELCGDKHILKVILETCLLRDEEIVLACKLAMNAGAHFVKTSTGFSTAGATTSAIRLMRETVGDHLGVKASGGVSDRPTALAMLEAGATRIGSSKATKLI